MRELDWDGSRNLRDLGGIVTPRSATGRTIAGRVARGPRRELLTQRGWDAAARWGLRTIVDLRSPDEIGARPGDPSAVPPEAVAIAHAPTEDQLHPEFRAVCLPILDSPEYWDHNVRIQPELVKGALEAVADAEPGVLVHCVAGRDRTGMISAILLGLAGASVDAIVEDHAESVRAMTGTAAHGALSNDRQADWSPAQVEAWLAEVDPFVRGFAEDAEGVLARTGVRSEARERLRALLVAPAQRKPRAVLPRVRELSRSTGRDVRDPGLRCACVRTLAPQSHS